VNAVTPYEVAAVKRYVAFGCEMEALIEKLNYRDGIEAEMKAEEHPCSGEGCLECRDFDNRQTGRKEVLEWVKRVGEPSEADINATGYIGIGLDDWQVALEYWGEGGCGKTIKEKQSFTAEA